MNQRIPPRIALWIVEQYGSSYKGESLAGDLIEQFQQGESRWWFWQQVAAAILVAGLARIQGIFLLSVLRLFLRISMDIGAVLAVCAIVDQSRHTHSIREMFTPTFMTMIAVLVAAVASAFCLIIWTSRRKHANTAIKKVVAAFAVITLGFGALTWAATTRDSACKSESCSCPKNG